MPTDKFVAACPRIGVTLFLRRVGPKLEPFGMELVVEDHDLHHRYGRGGKNYGKQTRIWDVLFSTVAPREEEAIYAADTQQ